ncbi:MAG: hypothetical protein ACLFPO_04115 [Spirochaetaceae bacterium]
MNVTRIENIELRDSPVKYRRVYTARAVLSHVGSDEEAVSIEFTVEDTADRGALLSLRLLETPHYPLLPARRAVRAHLEALQTRGVFV